MPFQKLVKCSTTFWINFGPKTGPNIGPKCDQKWDHFWNRLLMALGPHLVALGTPLGSLKAVLEGLNSRRDLDAPVRGKTLGCEMASFRDFGALKTLLNASWHVLGQTWAQTGP